MFVWIDCSMLKGKAVHKGLEALTGGQSGERETGLYKDLGTSELSIQINTRIETTQCVD